LNFIYASYNADLDSAVANGQINQPQANKRKISFSAGVNPWVIIDTDLNGFVRQTATGGTWPAMRQMRSGELLTLTTPQNSLKCEGMGTATPMGPNPIPAQYVLTRNEIKSINDAVASYNATIKQLADANGLAFVDANAILKEMESGLSFNGVTYSTEFVSGGAFSLDGVHPNTVGYAIIANAHIDAINSKYGSSIPKVAGGALTENQGNLKKINFSAGNNAFVINDRPGRSVPGLPNIRQALPRDLIILSTPQDSLKCAGWGSQKGIPLNYVLDKTETDAIKGAIDSYNSIIKQAADNNNLAFVDTKAILEEMEKGLSFNGVTYSTQFISGGAFSLDGVHPNTVGYAIIANAHIDAINSKYGSSIPKVDVNQYEGIVFP